MAEIGEMIAFTSDETQGSGYLARPAGSGSVPAVIVIQEWWGLTDDIKAIADRFAAAGFVALAPDLYHGQVATEPDEARKLAMGLDMSRAVQEIVAAVNYLCGRAEVQRIGAVGFCMGGSLALVLGSKTPRIDAVVAFYDGRRLDDALLMAIGCPVLALYGGRDQGILPEVIEHKREVWQRADVPHEIVVYEQADHAFFNDTRPEHYDPAAAADAWQRVLAFFHKQLQSA
ncbi:MAG TPA: dienelactone hydrolase family protein [Herpetosiphonaceae bacterium]